MGRPGEGTDAWVQVVTPGYFATMGTPLQAGRDFSDADEYGRPQVAIVNERLAREAFGGESPLGRTIRNGMTRESMEGMTIVGVVAGARQTSPSVPPEAETCRTCSIPDRGAASRCSPAPPPIRRRSRR